MAGTDKTKPAAGSGPGYGPAVILIDPQLGENIGMVARAMLNCGLGDLRLVRPRDGWPNPAAEKAASGADQVLATARLFYSTADAVADLRYLLATTARTRDLLKPVVTPRQAALEIKTAIGAGRGAGVLFGPERSGLTTDDVTLADAVVRVPLNPAFSSLNLAQAVLLLGYEWYQLGGGTPAREMPPGASDIATREKLFHFFARLEAALDDTGFMYPPEKRPAMVRNLRNLFTRIPLTDQEVRTLEGVLSALLGRKKRNEDR